MSELKDYRCLITGVSLIGAECAVLLLEKTGESWCPVTLPLWGQYLGRGLVEEVSDGDNAHLILAGAQQLLASGKLSVDWEELGSDGSAPEHIEELLALLAVAEVHAPEAMKFEGRPLRLALASAHVLASLMEGEAKDLGDQVAVDDLADQIFKASELGRALHAPLQAEGPRTRCRFGITLVGLAALKEGLAERGIEFAPPGAAVDEDDDKAELWLAQAMARFIEDAPVLEALRDYAASFASAELVED